MEDKSKTKETPQLQCDLCNVKLLDKLSWESHLMGKKHKKALEWFSKKEETRTHGIYVRGFPPWATPDMLQKYFSQFGEIKDFFYGGTRGTFAIVQFVSRYSAQECLSNRLYFFGWQLHISQRRVNEDPPPAKKSTANEEVKSELNHTHVLNVLPSRDSLEEQLAALMHELELTDTDKFAVICQTLEATFCSSYPGCKAYPFGSSVTGLAFKGSDMDVFMDLNLGLSVEEATQDMQAALVNKAKRLLYRSCRYYINVISIPKAKTPIVKFIHSPTFTRCDLSFKNALGVHNSALIKYYLSLDERLKPLLIIIKYWAKKNDLSGTGKLTHYALVMLVIFYLQQLSPPIVPSVYSIRSNSVIVDGWECSFDPNAWSPEHEKNFMSIPELVTGFLKFAAVFEYGIKVICPLTGESVPKSLFLVPEQLPKAMDRYKEVVSSSSRSLKVDTDMCIQDPYELSHNLAAGMNLKKLELLKSYCGEAAKICAEVLSSPECNSVFLQILFEKMNIPETPQRNKLSLLKIPFRKTPTCNIMHEDELRQWWFKAVFEFVLKVFQQILKCDVKVEDEKKSDEAGQSLRKIQKLDGQADVGKKSVDESSAQSSEKHLNEKKIHCSGICRVWNGRKAASKEVHFVENIDTIIDPIIKETILSDFLSHKQEGLATDSIVKFTCIFRPKQDPTEIELKLINEECSKGDFISLSTFLHRRLPRWVEIGLNQP